MFRCISCNKEYKTNGGLEKHNRLKHPSPDLDDTESESISSITSSMSTEEEVWDNDEIDKALALSIIEDQNLYKVIGRDQWLSESDEEKEKEVIEIIDIDIECPYCCIKIPENRLLQHIELDCKIRRDFEKPKIEDNIINNVIDLTKGEEIKPLEEEKTCIICMTLPSKIAFVDCGHMVTCECCSNVLMKKSVRERKCPVCRKKIKNLLRIFT